MASGDVPASALAGTSDAMGAVVWRKLEENEPDGGLAGPAATASSLDADTGAADGMSTGAVAAFRTG
ncbi:MAG: hypothetical protein LBQ25_00055 [Azonexus sp.]|nr:hypothetical protein [Azonexus sp.]